MLEHTKKPTTKKLSEICLRLPEADIPRLLKLLRRDGLEAEQINREQEFFTLEEVFPDTHPGNALRGARYREELTQQELADKSGIHRRHISEMENGKRPIGKNMAKKLGDVLNVGYKAFL